MAAHPVDAALFTKLATDAPLMALATGGVWRDLAPQTTTTKFVIVKMQSAEDTHSFGNRRPVEEQRYSIDAIVSGTDDTIAEQMCDRIDLILDHGTLAITGYALAHMEREERFAYIEADGDARWQHRGGIYRIQAVRN